VRSSYSRVISRPWRPGKFSREAIELFAGSRPKAPAQRQAMGIRPLNEMVDLGVCGFWLSLSDPGPEPDDDPRA
jgi:hypothetical protein